ncbi:Homeobox and leucine zipper protein Homez [Dissostichus eleginoides]|uniref:Homeobox and leucine zipper protein Homez n=1 Tax=Dissostichus eleginoides TaxID=100907 RepID=A0AAD9F6C8_DISEL|nr:Homeobox and leucine zipper protein Homez [Dissostichus eleginoides]
MRQNISGGSRLIQKTTSAPGENLSEPNVDLMAFNLNQSNAVCLPVVCNDQKLIWVHSNEFNRQLDGAEELDKAFDQFPYLTEKQTATLAQRCSFHPDQVKVWFMIQRLRYGISWEFKDIRKVRRQFKLSRGEAELQNRKGEQKEDGDKNKKCKTPDGKKAGEVRDEQGASEGRISGENVEADELLERRMRQEQLRKKDKDGKVEEKKRNTQRKRKRTTVTDEVGIKKTKQEEENIVEGAKEANIGSECQKSTQSEITLFTERNRKPKAKTSVPKSGVPNETQDAMPLLIPLVQTQAPNMPPLTDNQKELLGKNDDTPPSTSNNGKTPEKSHCEEKSETQTQTESTTTNGGNNENTCALPTRVVPKTKTPFQLTRMKEAFTQCQYPDVEAYNRLGELVGMPRYKLVQWYGDMRYHIKRFRPHWMTSKQHGQAVANVRYRQSLRALWKKKAKSCAPNNPSMGSN